ETHSPGPPQDPQAPVPTTSTVPDTVPEMAAPENGKATTSPTVPIPTVTSNSDSHSQGGSSSAPFTVPFNQHFASFNPHMPSNIPQYPYRPAMDPMLQHQSGFTPTSPEFTKFDSKSKIPINQWLFFYEQHFSKFGQRFLFNQLFNYLDDEAQQWFA